MLVVWGGHYPPAASGVGNYSSAQGRQPKLWKFHLLPLPKSKLQDSGFHHYYYNRREKNDLIVNQWPHPNNHGLIIFKENCLLHSCQLANETNYIGTWLYSLVIIPWKQQRFEFTLHLILRFEPSVDRQCKNSLSQPMNIQVFLFVVRCWFRVEKENKSTKTLLLLDTGIT